MPSQRFRFLGIGVLILSLISMAWTQPVSRGPRGKVKVLISTDPAHLRPKIIRVSISSVEGGNRQTAILKGEQTCVFANVPRGEYVLSIESQEFSPVEQTFTLNPFSRSDEIVVNATLKTSKGESFPERSESTVRISELVVPAEAKREMKMAEKESRRNHPETAIEHLNRAIEICPGLYEAYNNLAVENLRLGRVDAAEAALLKSIEIQPGDATTHRNLAEVYLSQGRLDDALKALDTSFGLYPHNGRSLMILGEIYRSTGECEIAVPVFLTATSLDPESHSYLGLADCFARIGDIPRAREELRGFLKKFPKDQRSPAVRTTLASLD
jgi:tetratricopeptide (TPR) repeat protein